MKLQFLGTGAAEGTPAVFCQCAVCNEARRRGGKDIHTRAQFIIDDFLGIDFPPDAYYHAFQFGVDLTKLRRLLITHSHMDHFYAHDFILRGYKYSSLIDSTLTIYGNAEVVKVFEECTRRELRDEVAQWIKVEEVFPFSPFQFEGFKVTPLPAQHSKVETAFVYLIEKDEKAYLHLTDTGRLPLETLEFLEKHFKNKPCVQFVTFDCTFLFHEAGEISRHMGLEDNKAMQIEFFKRGIVDENTRYAITHYSHNGNPLSERLKEAEQKYGYIAAFDGMKVEF